MPVDISRPCEPSGEQADVCDEDPSFGGSDGALEVLCQPSASPEPGEGSLYEQSVQCCVELLICLVILGGLGHRAGEPGR